MNPTRIMLVETQVVFRNGIRELLPAAFEIVHETNTGADAVAHMLEARPDIVVTSYRLPDGDGISLLKKLREMRRFKAVMLSSFDSEDIVIGALVAGATGFVTKTHSSLVVVEALERVAAGGCFLCPVSTRVVIEFIARKGSSRLTTREYDVLKLIAEGQNNKGIAVSLELKELTVRSYRKTLMKKLGAKNAVALVSAATREGLLESRPHRE